MPYNFAKHTDYGLSIVPYFRLVTADFYFGLPDMTLAFAWFDYAVNDGTIFDILVEWGQNATT